MTKHRPAPVALPAAPRGLHPGSCAALRVIVANRQEPTGLVLEELASVRRSRIVAHLQGEGWVDAEELAGFARDSLRCRLSTLDGDLNLLAICGVIQSRWVRRDGLKRREWRCVPRKRGAR